jgi:hypothetical protein
LIAVLDAVVLKQLPDRPVIMAAQLRHLAQLGELPKVRIQVVPPAAGPHPGFWMSSGFTVLDFPEPQGPAPIHPPGFTEDGHPDTPTDVEQCRAAFDDMLDRALDEDATRDLLLETAEKYQAGRPPSRPVWRVDLV